MIDEVGQFLRGVGLGGHLDSELHFSLLDLFLK